MTVVDSHCHLDDSQFDDDRDATIKRAQDAGVSVMLAIGTGEGPPDLEVAIRLADRYEGIYATAGIHPQYAGKICGSEYAHLADLLQHQKCVALGEIGLDYHWEPYDKAQQAAVFTEQLRVAAKAQKPVIIHTRDAWDDTMQLLREHWAPTSLPCIMHCFTGNAAQAREALDLGFYLSFAGVVTYPKAAEVQAAAAVVPADRLLVETDAPYLAPAPMRGKRNEPAFVNFTIRKIADLRREAPDKVAAQMAANFARVFLPTSGQPEAIKYTERFG